MSQPLRLNRLQLTQLSIALAEFSNTSTDTGVSIAGPGGQQFIEIGGCFLEIAFGEDGYYIDEVIGR